MRTNVPVVLRYRDGTLEKCMASPYLSHTAFSIQVLTSEGEVKRVAFEDLKAVFFVKVLESDNHEPLDYNREHSEGPKAGKDVTVTFHDGETIRGRVLGSLEQGCGFFLRPADPRGNNEKIFVVMDALKEIHEES